MCYKLCQASELACQHVMTFDEPSHGAVSQDGEVVNALLVKEKQQNLKTRIKR